MNKIKLFGVVMVLALSHLSALATVSSSPEFKALGTLSQQYDGISIGFSFSGKVAVSASDVEDVVNKFGKLF